MQDFKIDGVGKIGGGEYGRLTIDGLGACEGDLKAEALLVDGTFTSRGALTAGSFVCDGLAKFYGNMKVDKIEVDGMLSVKGGTKVEATEIFCDGFISLDGEMSADRIEADGSISAREIVGDRIRILSRHHGFAIFSRRSRIELIEATEVEISGVIAREVNGKVVTIGPDCRIDLVDCSGSLYVSPRARVGKITGNYTERDRV
jgi:cytoskeletal protein CcmA (bactofilin family)